MFFQTMGINPFHKSIGFADDREAASAVGDER
jgi:hypothetical protein